MTIEEIETQFDGEWVLVGDPETDVHDQVARGKVLCHSPNRDEVYAYLKVARAEGFTHLATLCNKEAPRGLVMLFSDFHVSRGKYQ